MNYVRDKHSAFSSKALSQTPFFTLLTYVFPEWPKDNNENTDVVATSSNSNSLVTEDPCHFSGFSSVGNQFLACKCYGVL